MKNKSGFTLVELVVVIMILGILAGVAAPKFLDTSADATDNGARQTLAIIRDAIELHTAQSGGSLPLCTGDGSTDFLPAVEVYLRGSFPACPVGTAPDNKVTPVTGVGATANNATGWMYNTQDGTFIINSTATSASGTGVYSSF